MSKPLINAERYADAVKRRKKELTAKNFPVDLHTPEGIALYAKLWAFAGRAARYQTYDAKTDTVHYFFDVTMGSPTALLIATDYAQECGYLATACEIEDRWGGSRKFVEVKITPAK